MKAEPVMDERYAFDERSVRRTGDLATSADAARLGACIQVPLAFVADEVCVLRYDNEAGKGNHRHIDASQERYVFTTVDQLLADFRRDIEQWRRDHEDRDF